MNDVPGSSCTDGSVTKASAAGSLLSRPAPGFGAERAQRGRAGRPQGLPPKHFLRDPPYIGISVLFLRLVGLLSAGPCMALLFPITTLISLRRWLPIITCLPHNPWSLPQASLIGPKLGQAGGISRGAQSGPVNTLITT